jgi:hypothetical protein
LGLPGSGEVRLDFERFRGLVVCDVIPNPPDTLSYSGRGSGGRPSTVAACCAQSAAINIKFWTGVDPDREVMGRALDQAIANWAHP